MIEKYQHPKKNMASGAIISDGEGRFLVVKPTYKNYWHLPGGVVEENESPLNACERELKEEINLTLTPNKLLAINYTGIIEEGIDALVFVFDCGSIDQQKVKEIKIPKEELEDYKFIEENDVYEYLDERMAKIVAECLRDKTNRNTLYLDNMIRKL